MQTLVLTHQIHTHSTTRRHKNSRKHGPTTISDVHSIGTDTKIHPRKDKITSAQDLRRFSLHFVFPISRFVLLLTHNPISRLFSRARRTDGEQEKEMNTNIMTSFHDKPLIFERGKRKFNHSLHGQRIELSHFLIIKPPSGKRHGWSTEWGKG